MAKIKKIASAIREANSRMRTGEPGTGVFSPPLSGKYEVFKFDSKTGKAEKVEVKS